MMTPKKTPLINLDSVKDIFGKPIGWMLYWGNASILLLLVLLVCLTAIIRYPDKVELEVQITTPSPPSPLVTSINGSISEVFIEEGESVDIHQNILLLDNPANRLDIEQLDLYLTQIQALKQATDVLDIELPEDLDLGELGTAYAELLNHTITLKYWLNRSSQGQRAERINSQLAQRKEQDDHLLEQLSQLTQEKVIAENNARQYQELFDKGAASQLEVDQASSQLLQAQRQLEGQENILIQNKIQREGLELEKIRIGEQLSDQVSEQWLGLKHQQRSLHQALNSWSDRYIVKAKAAGIITYFQPLSSGQYLKAGQQLGSIVPSHSDSLSFIAEGYLSGNAIGKIQSGQTVFIALDAYPYREFGQIKGLVNQLALAQQGKENGYRILIELPQKLLSTYNKKLPFRQQLKGNANIITEERSLLSRILDRFNDLWKG